jgi:hypothetical protein
MHRSAIGYSEDQRVFDQYGQPAAGRIVDRGGSEGAMKCRRTPSNAVPAPPWNALSPSSPLAMPWKSRIGVPPNSAETSVALSPSRTPQVNPAHKIVYKEEALFAVIGIMMVSSILEARIPKD